MLDFRKLYMDKVGPLQEAKTLVRNELYITEDGTRIRYLGEDNGSMSFDLHTRSPLNEGYLISELSNDKGGLPLFWKFLNKQYDYSNTD